MKSTDKNWHRRCDGIRTTAAVAFAVSLASIVLHKEKNDADKAFDAAACIGCGACVATCKNASAMLFVSAKVSQYAYLPQGQVERKERVKNMVQQMDKEFLWYY